MVMAVPAFVTARFAADGGFRPVGYFLEHGFAEPAPSLACKITAFLSLHWWWVLPLALAVLLLPTAYRIRHLRDRADSSAAEIIGEELAEAQPLLLAGVLCYPLVGGGFLQVALAPLHRMTSMLGG
jgi:hypothetical protein